MFTPAHAELIRRLVDMRHKAGLTQRELAKRLKREQSYIGRIETGQRRLDLIELSLYCKACECEPRKALAAILDSIADLRPLHLKE